MNDLLGRLLLMTIREDIEVDFGLLGQAWADHNLPQNACPRLRSPEDAFRRATPRKVWKNGLALIDYRGAAKKDEKGSSLETILVYSQSEDASVDMHHANRSVLFLFDGEMHSSPFTPLTQDEAAYVDERIAEFRRYKSTIDGSQIRNAIGRVLSSVSAVAFRDGSYLITPDYFATADGIVGFMTFLQPYTKGPKNVLWDIPYIDTMSTRRQMEAALFEHVSRVCKTVLAEAATSKKKGEHKRNVGRSRHSTLEIQLADTGGMISMYAKLLGRELPKHRAVLGQTIREFKEIVED